MAEIIIPKPGDFEGWPKTHDTCIAVDWDGTCKDTQIPKWTQCFNRALTEIWPALQPYQREVDEQCYQVNIAEEATAGVQRLVGLKFMMARWKAQGLPVPDLSRFFAAVDHVEASGEQHCVATYKKYQAQFGYDDSPLRWSDLCDKYFHEAAKRAKLFDNCRQTLQAVYRRCDLLVVSASKTESVHADLVRDKMTHLFQALCGQEFLPKKGIIGGLAKRYRRALFIGDMKHDVEAAHPWGVPVYLVKPGDEAASWKAARAVLERFVAGEECRDGLLYPAPRKKACNAAVWLYNPWVELRERR